MKWEKVFEGKLSEALTMAALGHPHVCITQADGKIEMEATLGFDMDNLFLFIKHVARNNSEFRKVLVDYIIELSEEIK